MALKIHPSAVVESSHIGDNTLLGPFVYILQGAKIGKDCNICNQVFIENDVIIGDRVTIKPGVQVWAGLIIEDDVFIGPNATFTNDTFPTRRHSHEQYHRTYVRRGAVIGANATILQGVSIGRNALVGAGSVVTKDVPPNAIVFGNPACIRGYASSILREEAVPVTKITDASQSVSVGNAELCELPVVHDLRGKLSFAEIGKHLPFTPQRYFLVYEVPGKEIRGEHAHRECHQFLVCIKGAIQVMLDDGENRAVIELNHPNLGLYIPPIIWTSQYNYSSDAVLLVLASDTYKAEDYIRDYDEFMRVIHP